MSTEYRASGRRRATSEEHPRGKAFSGLRVRQRDFEKFTAGMTENEQAAYTRPGSLNRGKGA